MPEPVAVERRIVTVLFADLVGFTTLSEQLDPEDVATVQDAYFATVRDTVARYGGTLEKFIGDAAMAVFGAPRARDDDATRAVRAALALAASVEELGARFGLETGALRLRVGVNSGEVVHADSGPDRGRVTGDTVNTAARLQTAAPPGGVMVGPITALAVADAIQLAQASEIAVKGKVAPVRGSLALSAYPEPSRERAMGDLRAPMLGREREMATLMDAYRRIREGGIERWVLVAAPGVGKSRLLSELATGVEQDEDAPVILRARLRPDGEGPYRAIGQLLGDALGTPRTPDRLSAALDRAAVAAGRRDVILEEAERLVDTHLDASNGESQGGGTSRAARFEAWIEAIDALTAGRPSVWIVEDLHWAGGDVLAFLARAGQPPEAGQRRLILASARPSLAAPDDASLNRLDLPQLPAADAGELVRALIGDVLPQELVARIGEQSDGTPLFIEELLRTWISVGTLAPTTDGGWQLTQPAADVPMPPSVQSIYAAQLDDLPGPERQLARRASVAGRRFPAELGVFELEHADEGLAGLRRRALVAGPDSDPVVGSSFSYRHALLRDAGYASLARVERARLHILLARWLEESAGPAGHAAVAGLIGRHYAAALSSAPALAAEVGDGRSRADVQRLAGAWLEIASRTALGLSAHEEARDLARHALDLDTDAPALDRSRQWQLLADATWAAEDMDAGRAAVEESIGEARRALGDAVDDAGREAARDRLASAAWSMAKIAMEQLDVTPARGMVERTLAEIGDGDGLAHTRLRLAGAALAYFDDDDVAAARPIFDEALAAARRAGDRRLEGDALESLLVARAEHRDPPSAEEWALLEEIGRETGDWPMAIGAITNSAFQSLARDPAQCFAVADRTSEIARARGLTEEIGWADYFRAEAAFGTGDWDLALEAGDRAIELGLRNAYHRVVVRTWHVLVPLVVARGDRDRLSRAIEWHEAQRPHLPDSPYARLEGTALDLWAADGGLRPAYVPDPERLRPAMDADHDGPSDLAAVERIIGAWLAAGQLDTVHEMLGVAARNVPDPVLDVLPLGVFDLLRGRYLHAAGAPTSEVEASARAALERLRPPNAVPWILGSLRLLDQIGAASDMEHAEGARLTSKLRLPGAGSDPP